MRESERERERERVREGESERGREGELDSNECMVQGSIIKGRECE